MKKIYLTIFVLVGLCVFCAIVIFIQSQKIKRIENDLPEIIHQAQSKGYGEAEGFYIEFCDCYKKLTPDK